MNPAGRLTHSRSVAAAFGLAAVIGCRSTPRPEPAAPPPSRSIGDQFKPYVPASRPAEPIAEALPTAPRDARPTVPLRYSVELWEILLPRDSVSADESFWKRVDEPVGPVGQQLLKNGIRTGELPAADLETVRKLIEDRGGKHITYNGIAGRLVELPIRENVNDQTVFHFDRDDELIGRTWDHCDDVLFFSFEMTPRNPDRLRISLTPAVRSREKKLQYAIQPGRNDRELATVTEQSQYDVTVTADLVLDRLLVIAPSPAARRPQTLGGVFLTEPSMSQLQERLILVIPHAFTIGDASVTPAKAGG